MKKISEIALEKPRKSSSINIDGARDGDDRKPPLNSEEPDNIIPYSNQ